MGIAYDDFTSAFLSKMTDLELLHISDEATRSEIVDGYMNRACSQFRDICLYNLGRSNRDDEAREFIDPILEDDVDEIVDIVSEGMVVQWLKPYAFRAENLQNVINTNDYRAYSPSELLNRIQALHTGTEKSFKQKMCDYSYNHGDLTAWHL